MEKVMLLFLVAVTLTLAPTSSAKGKSVQVPTPSPAPAPAPDHINITHLLSVAGPFDTFLSYLESTNVIDTFQNQANNSEQGITVFVPKDGAFSSLKKPSLKNLTADQLRSLCLFHALPQYYSMSDFKNLSQRNPVTTFAGGPYTLNFTDESGTVHISSEWTHTKLTSSVISTAPVAIYEVDKVLLPVAIFGTDIPPSPAPVPAPATAPEAGPVADSPFEAAKGSTADSSLAPASPSSAPRHGVSSITSYGSSLILGVLAGLALYF